MKYFETLIEDQETTISILYEEQKVKIYSSEPKTIHKLTKLLGKPQAKYIKSKTYWSGASWEIGFFESDKLKEIMVRDAFVDSKVKPIEKKISKTKEKAKPTKKTKTKKVEKSLKEEKKVKKVLKESKFEQIQFGF